MLKNLRFQILALGLLLVVVGCSSFSSMETKIALTTEPSVAEVTLIDENGKLSELGKTPIEITEKEEKLFTDGMLRLRFKKTGYVQEQVYVDTMSFKKQGEIHVTLSPLANWSGAYLDEQANRYLNDVAVLTAQVQGATVKGELQKAHGLGKTLVSRYPKLASGWALLGNIYYLQNNVMKAVESYQKSFDLDSSNQEVKNLLQKLGGRTTAGER